MPEYRNGSPVVLVGPAQVRIDQALDVRGQLDELFTFVSGDESASFDGLAPELLVTQTNVKPVTQHQVGDVTPPGVHAVERVEAHARQTCHAVIGGSVAGSQLTANELHGVKRLVPANQRSDSVDGLER